MDTSAGRLGVVVGAVILGFAVSSCGGDDVAAEPRGADVEPSAEETSPEDGSPDAEQPGGDGSEAEVPEPSPTPVPASSDGPAENWPEPEVPDEIYEETEEGALAALRYWFDADLYMELTGDSEPARAVADGGCVTCHGRIAQFEELYQDLEGWHESEGAEVHDEVVSSVTSDGEVSILFTILQKPFAYYSGPGALESDLSVETEVPGTQAILRYRDGEWVVMEVYFSEEG